MKRSLFAALLAASLAAAGAELSDKTLIRFAPMPAAPVIDGRIGIGEWDYASSTFGGISPASGIMTYRENNFRLGYDDKFLYFASTGEMPQPPQPLYPGDNVEVTLLPPGAAQPVTIKVDSTGKGNLPAGTKIANDFYADVLTSLLRKCWTIEMAIPLKSLGVNSIEYGKPWGVQMARNWASMDETGVWHLPAKKGELGTFIPDAEAPIISFDGFSHHSYRDSGNYEWPHRIENPGKTPITVDSEGSMDGISGEATLDMINLEKLGTREHQLLSPRQLTVPPGKTGCISLYKMAQFTGSRRLFSKLFNKKKNIVYYRRTLFWEVARARRIADYKEDKGIPYLCAGFYPSYGNKLRVAVTFNAKLPCFNATVDVKDASGKVLKRFFRSGYGHPLEDFEEETTLPGLPVGKYSVTMDAVDAKFNHYTHTRTFEVAKFPWQGLNLGLDRVIVPPFKPLEVKGDNNEIHALLTGYKIGGLLWDKIYAQDFPDTPRENILASPIRFRFNGQDFKNVSGKLISKEKDRVVYETTGTAPGVRIVIRQEYDYDGFCKATMTLIPQGVVRVDEFGFDIPLRNDVVKYFASDTKAGKRSGNAPDLTMPAGEGVLTQKALSPRPGDPIHYLWLGGIYKGFCFITDSPRDYSLDPAKENFTFVRNGDTLTCKIDIVNQSTFWQQPVTFTYGFEPTPVKPQAGGIRTVSACMYHYQPAAGSIWAYFNDPTELAPPIMFPQGTLINNDDSYLKFVFASRSKKIPEAERNAFADAFMERNINWMRKNMPTLGLAKLRRALRDRRHLGADRFLCYQNPALYSSLWPEAEMYKAEWIPADYPADDLTNEYCCTHSSSYIDRLLWVMRTQARQGYDGMNFDCFPIGGGFNTVSLSAYRYAPGKVAYLQGKSPFQTAFSPGIRSAYSYFSWRELTRRTATMLYKEGKLFMGYPWVELHSTNTQGVPITAFCSSTITWECGGYGDQYFARFPEGFIMAETAGTQSGIIPRCIVKIHANDKTTGDKLMDSLIGCSFAYGLVNHEDQGIPGGHKNYQLWRDYIFVFGYGKPENKTILFYSREKQPVTCDQKDILSTQVIRPDGKALILAGNRGEAVTARFDVSGLKYGKCKVTDVVTGKVLERPELAIAKNGFAMLLIEKE